MRFTQTNGDRGFGYYARMLDMLRRQGPMTAQAMAGTGNFTVAGLQCAFPMLHGADMVYIADWFYGQPNRQGRPSPVFAFGRGEDALCPTGAAYRRAVRDHSMFRSFAAMWAALAEPVSMAELSTRLGVARCTVGDKLLRLRKLKLARIVAYRKEHGDYGIPVPLYQLGSAPSVPRPKRISRKEANRNYWDRRAVKRALAVNQSVVNDWQSPVKTIAANSVFSWRGAA